MHCMAKAGHCNQSGTQGQNRRQWCQYEHAAHESENRSATTEVTEDRKCMADHRPEDCHVWDPPWTPELRSDPCGKRSLEDITEQDEGCCPITNKATHVPPTGVAITPDSRVDTNELSHQDSGGNGTQEVADNCCDCHLTGVGWSASSVRLALGYRDGLHGVAHLDGLGALQTLGDVTEQVVIGGELGAAIVDADEEL